MSIKFLMSTTHKLVCGVLVLATFGMHSVARAESAQQKELKKQSCFVNLGNQRQHFVNKYYPNILRNNSSAMISRVDLGIHDWEIYAQGRCVSGKKIDMGVWQYIQQKCPGVKN